jgi:type I restriction enzyme M protein
MLLTCPLRGLLTKNDRLKDWSFSEEFRRIQLIKFLLEKGYEKEEIKLEYVVKVGNSGRNHIKIDVCVLSENNPFIVCEVKKDSKNKEDAIEFQLQPAKNLTKAKFGIYFDGNENELFHKDEIFSISKLLKGGHVWGEDSLNVTDLRKIKDVSLLYNKLDQIMHNFGTAKEKRYEGLFQLLIAKYYDEEFNKEKLEFQIISKNNQIEFKRIISLYKKAYQYYSVNCPFDFQEKLILKEVVVIDIIKLFTRIFIY